MYCESTGQLGMLASLLAFAVGYLIARKNIWSEKTNQLLKITEVTTSEGKKKV